ncbi:MAG: protein translocase subunit SecD [Ruminococcaceae bacterium]|jgi:protein-export membrane protein SecD|nr:protein translocase subunit SecD [Oscillospiraceae bacterium]
MKKSVITLLIILALTAALLFAAFNGIGSIIPRTQDGIVLGLDLVGGSEITYEAQVTDKSGDLSEGMSSAIAMLRQRLDALGYTEANAYQAGDRQIVVEIPSISDPEDAVQKLGSTAVVTFEDADGKQWITGSDLDKAYYEYGPTDNSGVPNHHVVLTFNAEGQKKFLEGTRSVVQRSDGKNYLAICLDGEVVSSPTVDKKNNPDGINSDSAVITMGNDATAEDATYLANIISAGQMPFDLECVKLQGVGASLGERSLQTSLLAGLIGLLIVMLFMIVVYRVMGVISCIALTLYGALMAVLLSVFRINLSLPGIAGIILTVGMAVDANVVIYERIKEELRTGKTLLYAIDTGYKGALRAIVDSNITTIIAGVVLWIFGTGTIIGFAQTLLIGVILSMIIMLVVTRLLLHAAVGLKIRSPKAYCV